jgi:hypothetical protein
MATTIAPLGASYWITPELIRRLENAPPDSPKYAMALATIKRSTAQFVEIVTKRNLPVYFSTGKQSYATRDGQIVISAVRKVGEIDIMVGRALHEASHVILSNRTFGIAESLPLFRFLTDLHNTGTDPLVLFGQVMVDRATALNREPKRDLQMIVNVLEDRRIDRWMWNTVPGYNVYYRAFYENKIGGFTAKYLRNPMTWRPLYPNYEAHLIGMVSPAANPDVLPGLKDIWALVDLPNIQRYNTTGEDPRWNTWVKYTWAGMDPFDRSMLPQMIQDAVGILEIIYANAKLPDDLTDDMSFLVSVPDLMLPSPDDDDSNMDVSNGESDNGENGENGDTTERDEDESSDGTQGSASDNKEDRSSGSKETDSRDGNRPDNSHGHGDGGGVTPQDIIDQWNADSFARDLAKLVQSTDSRDDSDKKALTAEQQKMIQTVEETKASIETVTTPDFHSEVTVYHRIGPVFFTTPGLIFTERHGLTVTEDPVSSEAVSEGFTMGTRLAAELQIMTYETRQVSRHLKSGKLDRRQLAGIGVGRDDIFYRTETHKYDPVTVHLTVDSSTSMQGTKWKQALKLASALARVTEIIEKVRVIVSLRASAGGGPQLAVIFDSKTDKYSHVRRYWRNLRANGGTPEGLSFAAIRELHKQEGSGTRKYFVNLSDGEPYDYVLGSGGQGMSYAGDLAFAHTAREVGLIRSSGWRVLSYFIGNAGEPVISHFKQMYGREATFINPESVPNVASTLNQLFLS